MTTCVKCGAALPSESNAVGWGHAVDVCRATTECALRAELRDVKAERDIAVRERDDYYGALALLREAVLEIAELAQTTEGEDTGEFLAYRLREAVGK